MSCATCHAPGARIRCRDCLACEVRCADCCIRTHRALPLHRLERWTDRYFEETSLAAIGYVLHLGHAGVPCMGWDAEGAGVDPVSDEASEHDESEPEDGSALGDVETLLQAHSGSSYPGERTLVIVDISGVHRHRVRFCDCAGAEPADVQLLNMELFPASFARPSTAFTFALLNDFMIDNVECKTSASKYFNKLRRITSNAAPLSVPVSVHLLVDVAIRLHITGRTDTGNSCASLGSGDFSKISNGQDLDTPPTGSPGPENLLYNVRRVLGLVSIFPQRGNRMKKCKLSPRSIPLCMQPHSYPSPDGNTLATWSWMGISMRNT